jgi:uncharacterized protein (TIGR00106 family)
MKVYDPREVSLLVEFSIIPIGKGPGLSKEVAGVLKIVDESGLPYKVNPMGTVVEGEWHEVIGLIEKCHKTMLNEEERVVTKITIDDRKGKSNRIEEKVKSVENRLNKSLKK